MKTTMKALVLFLVVGALAYVLAGPHLAGSSTATGASNLPDAKAGASADASSGSASGSQPTGGAPASAAANNDQAQQIQALAAAVAANPGDTDAISKLGVAYFAAGNYPAAADAYAAGLEANPNSAQLHDGLAGAFLHLGLYGSARIQYGKAVALDPSLVEAHLYLGVLLAFATPPDLDGAKAELDKVIQLSPDSDLAQKANQYLAQLSTGH